ncbi:ankyrin repeat-containing domain protein [Baffinella frigidus]|nr:ankyrin repeat-containing domain protein [Cryptophyta sp. CCMP2293]
MHRIAHTPNAIERMATLLKCIHKGKTDWALESMVCMQDDDLEVPNTSFFNRTVLMEAVMNLRPFPRSHAHGYLSGLDVNDFRIILHLIRMGASTATKDTIGENAFHHAARHADYKTLYIMIKETSTPELMERGTYARRNDGQTPMHVAIAKSRGWGLISCFFDACMDARDAANGKDNDGRTPLHFAVMYNDEETVRGILENYGIENNVPDKDGVTAFMMTSEKPAIRQIFLDYDYTDTKWYSKWRNAESSTFQHSFPARPTPAYYHSGPEQILMNRGAHISDEDADVWNLINHGRK